MICGFGAMHGLTGLELAAAQVRGYDDREIVG